MVMMLPTHYPTLLVSKALLTDAAKADKKGGLGGRKTHKGKIGVAKAKKKGGLIGRKGLKGKVGRKALSDITDGVKEIDLNAEEIARKARRLAIVTGEIYYCDKRCKESLAAIPSYNEDALKMERMIGKLFDSAFESYSKSLKAKRGTSGGKAYDLDESQQRAESGRVFSLIQADDDDEVIEDDDNVN